jgi:hypothetical protein
MKQHTRDLLLMLVIGAGIGILGVYYWDSKDGETKEDTLSTTSSSTSTAPTVDVSKLTTPANKESIASANSGEHVELPVPATIPSNTRIGLSVLDQKAGKAVAINSLAITQMKWIAVYDERDGKPSWIIGARRFKPDQSGGGEIELLRPTEAGKTYYAALLNDDGNETFSRLTDLPPLSADQVVVVKFVAQ